MTLNVRKVIAGRGDTCDGLMDMIDALLDAAEFKQRGSAVACNKDEFFYVALRVHGSLTRQEVLDLVELMMTKYFRDCGDHQ